MKHLLCTVLLLISTSVFASKARVSSLQGAAHLVDTQTVFTNPAHIGLLSPFMTFEMGTAGGTPPAEGGFSQKLTSGQFLFAYLGHNNTNDLRDGTTYLAQQNPVEIVYGNSEMAFSGSLSTVDNKKSGTKETTLIGKFGKVMADLEYFAHLHLISTSEVAGAPDKKINAAPRITLGGNKTMGAHLFYGSFEFGQAKTDVGTASTNTKDTNLNIGWEDRTLKAKDADIYYGAQFVYLNRDIEGKKVKTIALPLTLGMEYNMNTWAIFRGSIQQNFLIGGTQDETAANTDPDGINNNTTFAGGIGLKYNSLTLDGSLAASTNGQINGTAFLVSSAVTYNF